MLAIRGQPEHVHAARAFTDLVLGAHAIDDECVSALLVSELVTNSLSHSDSGKPGGTVTVAVTITPEAVLVEVADEGGDGEPALREPASDFAERGRGLRLVDELADAWGYFGAPGRLVTWFELKVQPRLAPEAPGPVSASTAETASPEKAEREASHAIARA